MTQIDYRRSIEDVLLEVFDIYIEDEQHAKIKQELEKANLLEQEIFFTSANSKGMYEYLMYDGGYDEGCYLYTLAENWLASTDDIEDFEAFADYMERETSADEIESSTSIYCYDDILKRFGIELGNTHIYSFYQDKSIGKKVGMFQYYANCFVNVGWRELYCWVMDSRTIARFADSWATSVSDNSSYDSSIFGDLEA